MSRPCNAGKKNLKVALQVVSTGGRDAFQSGQSVGENSSVRENGRDLEYNLQLSIGYHMYVKEIYEARKRLRKDRSDKACSHMDRNRFYCHSQNGKDSYYIRYHGKSPEQSIALIVEQSNSRPGVSQL